MSKTPIGIYNGNWKHQWKMDKDDVVELTDAEQLSVSFDLAFDMLTKFDNQWVEIFGDEIKQLIERMHKRIIDVQKAEYKITPDSGEELAERLNGQVR